MTIHAIKRVCLNYSLWVLALLAFSSVNTVARADEQVSNLNQSAVQTDYLAWNNSDLSYWLNQYVGVGIDRRQLIIPNQSDAITSTNLVIGTQLSERFIVAGNAGFLSWSANNSEHTVPKSKDSIYWGLSTHWLISKQVSLKAQWQQIELNQKEQRLMMGVDVKLSF